MAGTAWTGSVELPKPLVSRALMEYVPEDAVFAADKVAPIAGVQLDRGTIPVVKREDMMRLETDDVAPGTNFGRVVFRAKGLTFQCSKRGMEAQIVDEDRKLYATAFDVELVKAKQVWKLMQLSRERRIAAALFSATWTGGGSTLYTDVSGSAPWTTTSSDFFTTLEAAKEKVRLNTGMLANAVVMNTTNVARLLTNTNLLGRFNITVQGPVTREMLKNALAATIGLELIECAAVKNTAAEGQDFTGANVWSNLYAAVCRVCKTADVAEPGVMRTLRWDNAMTGPEISQGGGPISVVMYREPQTGSDVLQVATYYDEITLGTGYSHLVKVAAS